MELVETSKGVNSTQGALAWLKSVEQIGSVYANGRLQVRADRGGALPKSVEFWDSAPSTRWAAREGRASATSIHQICKI